MAIHAVRNGLRISLETDDPRLAGLRAVRVSKHHGVGFDLIDAKGRFVGDSSPQRVRYAPWVSAQLKK